MDHIKIRAAVAVEVADADQREVARLLAEVEGHVGVRREGAVRPAAVDRHPFAAADLYEVGAAVAVEIPGEEGELAHPQIVEVEAEGAGEVEPLDLPEAAVLLLAPDVEVEP